MVGTALSEADVWKALQGVNDPEIPVMSVVEMKIIHSVDVRDGVVTVDVTPTFVGCPALDAIVEAIHGVLQPMGFKAIRVTKNFTAQWSTDFLDASVRKRLGDIGIASPVSSGQVLIDVSTACPYCKSTNTHLENAFGGTVCKQLFYCNSCRQSFEKLKAL